MGLIWFILPPRLTTVAYFYRLPNMLDDIRRDMWYLQDWAPAHNAPQVRRWFSQHFPRQWIGKNGPVLWPPRSPDLNPCDFFL